MSSINKQENAHDEEDFLSAMQIASSSVLSMAMQVAVELNLFDLIATAGPGALLSPADIASQFSTQSPDTPTMLDRILRLLASHSLLTATAVEHPDGVVGRLYGLTPVGRFFVSNEDGVSLSDYLLLVQSKPNMESWRYTKDAILEGGVAFEKAHGMGSYEFTEVDPPYNQVFNRGMLGHTTTVARKLLETYKGFDDLKTIVDVGGGIGTTISMITSKYPTIKGINFDLPHVIRRSPSYLGVEHVGGNMFESVPNSEAIFMKWILHNWDDGDCLKLLKNCYKALPEGGKVIVMEEILPTTVTTENVAKCLFQMDVIMLKKFRGGKERTEKEFDSLMKEAGFTCMKKICCVYNFWVIEFNK